MTDFLGTIAFLGVVSVIMLAVFANIDLVVQRKSGAQLPNGKIPSGKVMKAGYILVGLFLLFAFYDAGWLPAGSGSDSSDYSDPCMDTGMRC